MSKSLVATLSYFVSIHILLVGMAGTVACDENHERAVISIHTSVVCGDHHSQPLEGSRDEGSSPCLVHMCICGQVSEPARRFVADFVPTVGSSLATSDFEIYLGIHRSAIDRPPRKVA